MKALIQKVNKASVEVEGTIVGEIGRGILVFLGIEKGDGDKEIAYIVDKTVNLRIFESDAGKLDYSVADEKGELLIVSQFTLCADCKKGRRPDFGSAAPPEEALQIYEKTLNLFQSTGLKTQNGQFRSYMQISLVNDGPVTILIESPKKS